MIELHKAYAKASFINNNLIKNNILIQEKFIREELEKMMGNSAKDFNIEKEFMLLKKENM